MPTFSIATSHKIIYYTFISVYIPEEKLTQKKSLQEKCKTLVRFFLMILKDASYGRQNTVNSNWVWPPNK